MLWNDTAWNTDSVSVSGTKKSREKLYKYMLWKKIKLQEKTGPVCVDGTILTWLGLVSN